MNPSIIKSVEIDGFYRGRPSRLTVGIAFRGERKVFGLIHEGWMTHMCYGLDYFNAADVLKEIHKQFDKNPNHPHAYYFFFDYGTTCAEIKVGLPELERAFLELEMIDPLPEDHICDDSCNTCRFPNEN